VVVKLLKRISFGMRDPKAYCKEDNAGVGTYEIFTTGFDIEPLIFVNQISEGTIKIILIT